MRIDHDNLKWKLCDAYFSIIETTMTLKISFEEICVIAKVSKEDAEKIVPSNPSNYGNFFLKTLISKLDKEILRELETEIAEDTISSTYDKILEGLTLRFEKYLQYKQAFKILSNNSIKRIEVFLNVFEENYHFTTSLLNLIEKEQNCGIKILKSLALNIIFTKGIETFLKNDSKDIDSVIRNLDKFLSDFEDIGLFVGIIKKQS